jgi:hypothetical protein
MDHSPWETPLLFNMDLDEGKLPESSKLFQFLVQMVILSKEQFKS